MNKHVSEVRIIGATALLATAFLAGCAKPNGTLYEDPQGRFTMEVDPGWERVETTRP